MSAATVIRAADGDAVAERAAALIAELIDAALAARGGRAIVALTGGTTPGRGLPRCCARRAGTGVELWFGDERCVGPDDPASNYHMVAETLLGHATGALVHRIEGERGAEDAAAGYDALVRARVPAGADAVPVLDVLLLGIGEDGHVASLFPGNPALEARGQRRRRGARRAQAAAGARVAEPRGAARRAQRACCSPAARARRTRSR